VDVCGVVLTSGDEAALGLLDSRPLAAHAASALRGSGVVGLVVVTGPPGAPPALPGAIQVEQAGSLHGSLHRVLPLLAGADVVVLHDAHRPLAPPELVVRAVAAVRAGADAALPVVEVTETVKQVDAGGRIVRTVPRETLVQLQTPQAVRGEVLAAAHRGCAPGDPLLPASIRVTTVPGAADAFPVRDGHDLQLAAAVLANREAAARPAPGPAGR